MKEITDGGVIEGVVFNGPIPAVNPDPVPGFVPDPDTDWVPMHETFSGTGRNRSPLWDWVARVTDQMEREDIDPDLDDTNIRVGFTTSKRAW